jgi:hypothetical protein
MVGGSDLLDELRLMVYPVVLGKGKRLFGGTTTKKRMRLRSSRLVGDGVEIFIYETVRGRDRRDARFLGRRRQSRRYRHPCDPNEGRRRSSAGAVCQRAEQLHRGMLDSQWVAQQIGRPVIKAFNNILATSNA